MTCSSKLYHVAYQTKSHEILSRLIPISSIFGSFVKFVLFPYYYRDQVVTNQCSRFCIMMLIPETRARLSVGRRRPYLLTNPLSFSLYIPLSTLPSGYLEKILPRFLSSTGAKKNKSDIMHQMRSDDMLAYFKWQVLGAILFISSRKARFFRNSTRA